MLISQVKQGDIVKIKSKDVPSFMTKFRSLGPYIFNFPIFAITSVHNYIEYWAFTYTDGTNSYNINVPNSFTFDNISNKEIKIYNTTFEKRLEKSLNTQLNIGLCSGSDPEIFVEDQKGIIIPAYEFLPGKDKPLFAFIPNEVSSLGEKIYWDGFQAEFNTLPANCLEAVADSTQRGLRSLLWAARKYDKNAKLSLRTVMDISPEVLAKAKDEHVNFGCMPSLNAYNMTGKVIPARELMFRPAGGHIHLGFDRKTTTSEQIIRTIKAMDAILGVACVSMFAEFDDPRRRILYGLAGEHRLPAHGLEYRVLSNAWLIHPTIYYMVFDLARKAFCMGYKNFQNLWEASEGEVIAAINGCDVKLARKILKRNKTVLIKILESIYTKSHTAAGPKQVKSLYDVWLNGMETIVANPNDIAGNWMLDDGNYNRVAITKSVRGLLTSITTGKKVA